MNNQLNFRGSTFPVLFLVLLLSLQSCTKEEIAPNEQFAGAYNVSQTGDIDFDGEVDDTNYTLTITESGIDDSKIIISNLGGFSDVIVDAEVSGNSFTIPQQSIDFVDRVLGVSGSGSINVNSLTYSFQLSWQGSTYDFSCTGLKR